MSVSRQQAEPISAFGGAPPRASIQLLGKFAVWRGEQQLRPRVFGGRLPRRLLRMLALSRGTLLSKDAVAEALWPTSPPADVPGNVEILISRIRRALGDRSLIETGPGGYTLVGDDRCWVDAEAFLSRAARGQAGLASDPVAALAAFREALALWHGEPLAEDACADWAQEHRRYLWRALQDALEGAAMASLTIGDPTSAVAWAQSASERQPLRETAMMLLVRALAASGDRAAALATFDTFWRSLADELGVDPSVEALDLRQRVLRDEIRIGRAATGLAFGADAGAPNLPFVDREDVCAQIAASAGGDGPRVLLVRGHTGVGRSRLLAEVAKRAEVPVVLAQASREHRNEDWALARDVLRAAWRFGSAVAALRPEEAHALSHFVPDLVPSAVGSIVQGDVANQRAFALQAAVRLIDALARPRCVVAVDDLQWVDDSSLTLLQALTQRVAGVVLIVAYRSEEPPDGINPAEALAGLDRELVREVDLGPLPGAALAGLFADPVLNTIVVEQTDRTPAVVVETLGTLVREGLVDRDEHGRWRLRAPSDADRARAVVAAGVRSLVRQRVAAMPADRREMLALLALLGRHAPARVLATAAGREVRDTLEALDGLSRAGLVEGGSDGWTVASSMLGRALAEGLDPSERARLHLLLALALPQHGADVTEVARHLAAGGDRQAAATAFAAAAAVRLDLIADEEALRLAEAGLALSPQGRTRAPLLQVRGEARRRRGQLGEARADLECALNEIAPGPDRSRTLARLAILEARSRNAVRGGELVELAIAEAGDDPAARGQALAAGAIIDLTLARLDRAERRFQQAHALLEQAGDINGTARLLYWQGMARFVAGRLAEAITEFDRLAHLLITPGEVLRLWNPRAARGHALVFMAEPTAGLAEIDEALTWARAVGHPAVQSSCLWRRSEALAALGRHPDAVDSAQAALAIARRIGHVEWTTASLRGLGIAWQAAGDLERAENAFRGSLRTAEAVPLFAAWASARLGLVLVGQGRFTEAEPLIEAALQHGVPLTRHEARWAHAELLHARGDDTGPEVSAALEAARESSYLALVPRLAELAHC